MAVKIRFHDLPVTPEKVARYAGGSHYRPDTERKKLATDILEGASILAQPAFVYGVRHINTLDFEKGFPWFSPPDNPAAGAIFMAAAICTLGPALENETSKLLAQGKYLDALFMDAAGVALVEALSDEVHAYLGKEAARAGLFAGCRFGPGYENIPLSAQQYLFESVHPEVIGVSLKSSGVLFPLKSSSFWVLWTSQPPAHGSSYKCQNCTRVNCAYRVVAPPR